MIDTQERPTTDADVEAQAAHFLGSLYGTNPTGHLTLWTSSGATSPRPAATSPRPAAPSAPTGAEAYWRKALREVEHELARAPGGQQNETLNRAAFDLGSLAAAYRMTGWACFGDDEAWAALWRACRSNGLAHDRDNGGERSCRASFHSGWEAGLCKPRELPRGLTERVAAGEPDVDPRRAKCCPAICRRTAHPAGTA